MKCEVCNGNVEVVGKTTMSYRNLDQEKITKLEAENKIMKEALGNLWGSKAHVCYHNHLIEAALKQCDGNKAKAAQLLHIDRSTLWRRMQKMKIN